MATRDSATLPPMKRVEQVRPTMVEDRTRGVIVGISMV